MSLGVLNLILTEANFDVNTTTQVGTPHLKYKTHTLIVSHSPHPHSVTQPTPSQCRTCLLPLQHTRTPLHTTCAALRSCIQTPFDVRLQDRLEQQRMKVESLLKHGADPTSQDQVSIQCKVASRVVTTCVCVCRTGTLLSIWPL